MRETTIVLLCVATLVALGIWLTRCAAERQERDDFIDACKQEQPEERCQRLWEQGGVSSRP